MAASLVADYLGSSSENEEDDQDQLSNKTELAAADNETVGQDSSSAKVDYFACNEDSSDDDSKNDSTTRSSSKVSKAETVRDKLPNPFSAGTADTLPSPNLSGACQNSSSVFVTSFQIAEEAKQSILERHVKMTTLPKEEPKTKKKLNSICRSFQLGKCRYGSKCRYNHGQAVGDDTFPFSEQPRTGNIGFNHAEHQTGFGESFYDSNAPEDEEDTFELRQKRRNRAGVTDSLIPPKRALTALDRQRETDKPWTSTLKKK